MILFQSTTIYLAVLSVNQTRKMRRRKVRHLAVRSYQNSFVIDHFALPLDIVENSRAPHSVDQRMDFEGLFSGDMGELSNMESASQMHPTDEENIDPSQWQQQDDLNLDDHVATGGLSDEMRAKLDECQNELDRLNTEKANLDSQLAQMNNPALRVSHVDLVYFLENHAKHNRTFSSADTSNNENQLNPIRHTTYTARGEIFASLSI